MMKYIQKDIGIYEVADMLSDNYAVGTTAEDLSNGKFVLLNEQQEAFLAAHPKASIYEIFNKSLAPTPEIALDLLKQMKVREIEAYDKSENVNCFYINGNAMWLDRSARVSLTHTIVAYKTYLLSEITLWTEGASPTPITLTIPVLESLLINLEMYAKACFDTTAQHKATIQSMDEISKIIEYDHTIGYPKKLVITT